MKSGLCVRESGMGTRFALVVIQLGWEVARLNEILVGMFWRKRSAGPGERYCMLRYVSVRVKSNMVYEILYELFSAFLVWMQAIRFVEVMSGPKIVKVTDKAMPSCGAKGFQPFMYTV